MYSGIKSWIIINITIIHSHCHSCQNSSPIQFMSNTLNNRALYRHCTLKIPYIEVHASDMWLSYDKTERAGLQRESEIFMHHSSTILGRPHSKVALNWCQKVVQRQGNFHTHCIYSKEGSGELPKHLVHSRILIG